MVIRKLPDSRERSEDKVLEVLITFECTAIALVDHPALLPMISRLCLNFLRLGIGVSSNLSDLTVEEGFNIGRSLAAALKRRLSAEAGVDEWIGRYRALCELDEQNVWFRPMIVIVAKQLLKEAAWGAKMRLYVGAGLSMVDLASDIAMVVTYSNEGQVGNAGSLLMMISACLLIQLFAVFVQTSGGPRRVIVKEMLIVLSGTKPGVDAMRVASGAEQNEYNAVDPMTELTITRCVELFCEAIPGSILQFTAAMRVLQGGGRVSNIAVGSIVISALTTGYSSACIGFDYDVDPRKRRDLPDFYVSRARRGSNAHTLLTQNLRRVTFPTPRCRGQ